MFHIVFLDDKSLIILCQLIFVDVIYVLLTVIMITVKKGKNNANFLKLNTPNNTVLNYFHVNSGKPKLFYFKIKTLLIKEFELKSCRFIFLNTTIRQRQK